MIPFDVLFERMDRILDAKEEWEGDDEYWRSGERVSDIVGLRGIQRMYQAQSIRRDPEQSDLIDGLTLMKDFYGTFVRFAQKNPKLDDYWAASKKQSADRKQRWARRYDEIRKALRSKDVRSMMITLDNAVNTFHNDLTVLNHLEPVTPNKEIKVAVQAINSLMTSLGRKAVLQ